MGIQHKLYTIEEFERFVNALENAERLFELIDGEIIEVPTPTPKHNAIVMYIAGMIFLFLQQHNIGRVFGDRTGYTLSNDDELTPDVSYISYERQPDLPQKFTIAPDLAIEVISPSNTADEIQKKIITYFQYGTRLIWIVYPDTQTVVVHLSLKSSTTLLLQDVLDGGDVLPGFRLPVQDIFSN